MHQPHSCSISMPWAFWLQHRLMLSLEGPFHLLHLLHNFFFPQEQRGSQDSLDFRLGQQHTKSYDAVVFDVLRVSPEDFAVSIGIIDLRLFRVPFDPIFLSWPWPHACMTASALATSREKKHCISLLGYCLGHKVNLKLFQMLLCPGMRSGTVKIDSVFSQLLSNCCYKAILSGERTSLTMSGNSWLIWKLFLQILIDNTFINLPSCRLFVEINVLCGEFFGTSPLIINNEHLFLTSEWCNLCSKDWVPTFSGSLLCLPSWLLA